MLCVTFDHGQGVSELIQYAVNNGLSAYRT